MKASQQMKPFAHTSLFSEKLYLLILKSKVFSSKIVMTTIEKVNLFSLEMH